MTADQTLAAPEKNLTLVCNAAEGVLQMLVLRENALLCAQDWPAPTRSTEILAPALAHMLRELGCSCQNLARIACVYGPGSFTGIRLVLSTAAALRRALNIPVAPLDFMETLACSAHLRLYASPFPPPEAQARTLWVLTHARRGLVHCQPFRLHAATFPEPLSSVDLYSLSDCAARINERTPLPQAPEAPPLCLGSGLHRNHAFFAEHCPTALFCAPAFSQPDSQALMDMAERAAYSHQDPSPLYIRPCDAVENLPAMAAKQGQNPAQSQSRLDSLLQRPATPDILYRG